ncbi:MAG: hypothetical protein ACLQFR_05365 [Streptosporangiaceae bacterium]
MGRVLTRDVGDAVVAPTAADLRADVVTGDRAGIRRLLQAAGAPARSSTCSVADRHELQWH